MSSLPDLFYSLEEYLELESRAEDKHEYVHGHIYAMAGASPAHNVLVANLIGLLHSALRGHPCRVYASDQRVKVAATTLYTYPDVTVLCGSPEVDPLDPMTVTNPTAIFEVLSPSTEAYDRGDKLAHYQKIETLRHYVLVSQDKPRIEVYDRQEDEAWRSRSSDRPGDRLDFPSINVTLLLSDVYESIDFSAEEAAP